MTDECRLDQRWGALLRLLIRSAMMPVNLVLHFMSRSRSKGSRDTFPVINKPEECRAKRDLVSWTTTSFIQRELMFQNSKIITLIHSVHDEDPANNDLKILRNVS